MSNKDHKASSVDRLVWTREQAALVCGVSLPQFDSAIRPWVPADGIRYRGHRIMFVAKVLVDTAVNYRLRQAVEAPAALQRYLQRGKTLIAG